MEERGCLRSERLKCVSYDSWFRGKIGVYHWPHLALNPLDREALTSLVREPHEELWRVSLEHSSLMPVSFLPLFPPLEPWWLSAVNVCVLRDHELEEGYEFSLQGGRVFCSWNDSAGF